MISEIDGIDGLLARLLVRVHEELVFPRAPGQRAPHAHGDGQEVERQEDGHADQLGDGYASGETDSNQHLGKGHAPSEERTERAPRLQQMIAFRNGRRYRQGDGDAERGQDVRDDEEVDAHENLGAVKVRLEGQLGVREPFLGVVVLQGIVLAEPVTCFVHLHH